MSGLADILIEMGYKVSGSDREISETTNYLESRGATIFEGHESANISTADLVVFSSAVSKENPELTQAKKKGVNLCWKKKVLLLQEHMEKQPQLR